MSDKQLIAEAEDFLRRAPYLNYGTARKLVGAMKERQWISVNDSMPLEHSCRSERDGNVMTWSLSDTVLLFYAGNVAMGYTEDGTWYEESGYKPDVPVSHWMPLPAAPEE